MYIIGADINRDREIYSRRYRDLWVPSSLLHPKVLLEVKNWWGKGKRKLVLCMNFHVVSGQKELNHHIPGRNPEKKTEFKQDVVRRAVDSAIAAADLYSASADQRRSNHPMFLLVHDT